MLLELLFSLPPFSHSFIHFLSLLLHICQSLISFVRLSRFHSSLPLQLVSQRFWGIDEASNDGDSSGDHSRDCGDPLPFPVVQYIQQFGDKLDVRHFSAMGLARDIVICEMRHVRTGHPRDIAVDSRIKRWRNSGALKITVSLRICMQADSPEAPNSTKLATSGAWAI